jgi:ribosomal protein S18 acetylase RimI-like enzyme
MGTKQTRVPAPVVARLDPSHDRSSFDCGNETLNRYLATVATQDFRRGLAVPYVATRPPSNAVVGYFTLSATSIDLGALPEVVQKRLPANVVIGASLLGRLAVDQAQQRLGVGSMMVAAAANLSFAQSPLACVAMIVDAIDQKASDFYKGLGFIEVPEGPRRLFLLRESLAKYL